MAQQDATSQVQHGMDAWRRLVDDQMERLGSMVGELDQLQQRNVTQAATAVDEYSKLVKESFAYAAHLSSEWRRLTLDSAKRTADLATATKA